MENCFDKNHAYVFYCNAEYKQNQCVMCVCVCVTTIHLSLHIQT